MASAPTTHIVLGITIGLLASCIQSLGLTVQRKSHVLNEALPEDQQRVEHKRPLWLLGFAIFISSNVIGSLVQIAALPVVVLAPLGAISLLWNALFARLLLGDVLSPWMVLGTFLIAGGAILIAVFGIVPEQTRSLEDLLELFRRPAFIAYFSVLGFVVIVCLVITHLAEYSLSRRVSRANLGSLSPPQSHSAPSVQIPANPSTLTTSVTTTVSEAVTTERTPLLDRKSNASTGSLRTPLDTPEMRSIHRGRVILAISYASFSGILSGMCLLFAKSGVELLLLTIGGDNQFWRWQAWVLLLGLVAFALLQLWYLHKALIFADPTLVCPSAFCFYNLSSIANGLIYFNQLSLIPPLHIGLVTVGMVVLLGGVWVVSIQSGSPPSEADGWSDSGSEVESVVRVEVADEEEDLERPPLSRSSRSESSLNQTPQRALITDLSASQPLPAAVSAPEGLGYRRPRAANHLRAQTATYGGIPPVPNPVTSLGGGFQIGLSPVSPGFSIVPRERGRVVSGFADVVEQTRRERRRRTVSESDVRARGSVAEQLSLLPDGDRSEAAGQNRARARWRWLFRRVAGRP
ncbi:hypothetical protein HMN09_00634200 [Mycena chlorophos]|uniref:Uncharacterized protein n=1 Tax=Mycena chlorophos TaxID=658473 RepID=A0A8H6T2K7_MYCCL|nr:hypothetical protein HMN09_00634200 [Mycena chlorophos]